MRAIRFETFGDPSVLKLVEMAAPALDASTALVRVMAASINPSDVKNVAGAMKRLFGGRYCVLARACLGGWRGDVRLVHDEHDCQALRSIERYEHLHNLVRGSRVEVAGGFVGKKQPWRVDECPCDGDALLLPARKLARRVAFAIAESHELERSPRPLGPHRAAQRSRGCA